MANSVVRFFAFCSLMAGAMAQQTGPQFSIGGVVVNSQNGETIKRAQVVLVHFDIPGPLAPNDTRHVAKPGTPVTISTFTDLSGAFRFSAVPAGNYSLSAQKPGFTPTRSEGSRSLTTGLNLTESVEGVRLELTPFAVITGKVVDEEGQPVRGVNVLALNERMVDGIRQSAAVRDVVTNDRGMYRLWNLMAGKYYVKAAGKSGGTYLYAGDMSPRYMADEAFAPTYFGGGTRLDAAQATNLDAGAEARADLNLTMQPAYKIRGSLGNFVPRRTVKFELLSGDEDVSASRVSVNGDTGTFEIQDVLPGSFTLRATQNEAAAEVPISVGGGDLNGISVQLSRAVEIQVHRQVTNPPRESEGAALFSERITRSVLCTVSLHPPGRRVGPSYTAQRSSSLGSASGGGDVSSLPGVLPGTYRATTQCYGGYAKSVTFGTQDLLVNPLVTVQPTAAPPSIEIVATRGGGVLHGTVSIESATKNSSIAVLLVPQFTPSSGPVTAHATKSGDFRLDSLAPGSYIVYAFSDINEVEFRNPAFLQALTGGVNVPVEDNQETTITIMGLVR